ncbi:Uncharacterised protein [Mycobacteroides abscessus subsp. abscessus]|uniref:hypothetical protein n=1 Tax=Mycobacteroides abscessus TaxID=36809 RepID=UPI000928CB04|nr:hypothetical protein [Mycobacteroides abscessus]SHX98031.1 Uncharacterised protein [Mycobacteroides abscessus subsp. abscessus]SIC79445.1 Uncharacterised protein [Mycobacteroides abscessus subsp. abscessus]SKP26638.1 Uncharacterised protein [Mycobacteroides abscessus subsp. abscessus]
MSDNRYRITQAEGSLPTIVDSRGASVLAIDEREVNGTTYPTPVYASQKLADRVLAALNDSSSK